MSMTDDKGSLEVEIVPEPEVPETLPVMPLRNFVLFPQTMAPLVVTTEESKFVVDQLSDKSPHFIAVLQRKEDIDSPVFSPDRADGTNVTRLLSERIENLIQAIGEIDKSLKLFS